MKTFYARVVFPMLSLALPILIMTSCGKDPKTFTPQSVDAFVADNQDIYQTPDELLQADYMFVVDFGYSMSYNSRFKNPSRSKKDDFLNALYSFVGSLRSKNIDYRIGLVNGNVHASDYHTLSDDFLGGIFVDADMSTGQQNSLLGQLNNIGKPLQKNTNLLLGSAINVMNNQAGGFIRDGSQLVYVFVSDTDDLTRDRGLSSRTNSSFAQKLVSYKGDTGLVNARSIVVGYDRDGDSCSPNQLFNAGESSAHIISDVARIIEGGSATQDSVSSCILTGNFPQTLEDLAVNVRKPTDIFQLKAPNVDPYSIQVKRCKSGTCTTLSRIYNNAGNGWKLLNSNTIQIIPAPDLSTRIEIRYKQTYKLSQTPNLSTMQVRINGQTVPQNSEDGWAYSSSCNCISFHGSWIPNDGDNIKVDYQ